MKQTVCFTDGQTIEPKTLDSNQKNQTKPTRTEKELQLLQEKLKAIFMGEDPASGAVDSDQVKEAVAALLEARDVRIAALENDIHLLETELVQQRQQPPPPPPPAPQEAGHWLSGDGCEPVRTSTPSHLIQQQQQRFSPVHIRMSQAAKESVS